MINEIPQDALSLLRNFDLTGTDTSFPILKAGTVDCIVSEMTIEASKNKVGSHNLVIKLKTAMPWATREGAEKPAGFPIRTQIHLGQTEKYNPAQSLAQFKEAVLGFKDGPFGEVEQYIGKPVTVRLAIENSAEYGDQNVVKAYVRRRD